MQVASRLPMYDDGLQKLPPSLSAARSSSWQTGMGGDGSPTIKAGSHSLAGHSFGGSLGSSLPPTGRDHLVEKYPMSATSISSAPGSSYYASAPLKQSSLGAHDLSRLSSASWHEHQQQQQQHQQQQHHQQLTDAQALDFLMAQQVATHMQHVQLKKPSLVQSSACLCSCVPLCMQVC